MIIQQWHKIRIKNKQFYVNQLCDFYYILYEINFSIISNNDFWKGIRKTSILYTVCFGLKITLMSDIYLELQLNINIYLIQDSKKFKICFYRVNKFQIYIILVLPNKQKDTVQYQLLMCLNLMKHYKRLFIMLLNKNIIFKNKKIKSFFVRNQW